MKWPTLGSQQTPELVQANGLLDTQPTSGDTESSLRPRIIVSLDRSWYYRLGIQHFTYYRLIRRHGGIPLRIDYGRGPARQEIRSIARDFVQQANALLLSGGVDVDPNLYGASRDAQFLNPRRDRFELSLLEEAAAHNLPTLGICRGCQLLNVASGGTLTSLRQNYQLLKRHHGWRTHAVQIASQSTLANILATTRVSSVRSSHGMAIAKSSGRLRISGWSDDQVVEAIECTDSHWQVGVQWHPELSLRENSDRNLVSEFVKQARKRLRYNGFAHP